MSMAGIIFFCFIIVSYFVGVWAGMQVNKPNAPTRRQRANGEGKNLQAKMGLPPRRR